jgi:hypothetical protein
MAEDIAKASVVSAALALAADLHCPGGIHYVWRIAWLSCTSDVGGPAKKIRLFVQQASQAPLVLGSNGRRFV